jgi:(p)ppGpp synthase/HD superfamily hydrolase
VTLVADAETLAREVHAGATRKGGGTPFVDHPAQVASLLAADGADEALVAAAWLHDAVEDAGLDPAEVERRFGPRVAALVAAVTEPPKSVAWEERKRHTLERLAGADPDVARLKAADALANAGDTLRDLRTLGPAVWERFTRPRPQQLWWHASLARALRAALGDDEPLVRQLGVVVDELCLAGVRPDPASHRVVLEAGADDVVLRAAARAWARERRAAPPHC